MFPAVDYYLHSQAVFFKASPEKRIDIEISIHVLGGTAAIFAGLYLHNKAQLSAQLKISRNRFVGQEYR